MEKFSVDITPTGISLCLGDDPQPVIFPCGSSIRVDQHSAEINTSYQSRDISIDIKWSFSKGVISGGGSIFGKILVDGEKTKYSFSISKTGLGKYKVFGRIGNDFLSWDESPKTTKSAIVQSIFEKLSKCWMTQE